MSAAKEELLRLADRCEREEPSRALDCALAQACLPREGGEVWTLERHIPPRCTTSLDAAVTLVPHNFLWDLGQDGGGLLGAMQCHGYHATLTGGAEHDIEGDASTGALALCAASLRARAEAL